MRAAVSGRAAVRTGSSCDVDRDECGIAAVRGTTLSARRDRVMHRPPRPGHASGSTQVVSFLTAR